MRLVGDWRRLGYSSIIGGVSFLIPLLIAPRYLSFSFDSIPKVACLYVAVAVLLFSPDVLSGVLGWLLATAPGKLFVIFVSVQLLSLAASTFFSIDPQLSLFGTHWRYFGALSQLAFLVWGVVAAGWFIGSPPARTFALRACSLGGLLTGAYALSQFFGFDPILDAKVYSLSSPGQILRPSASLGHAGYMAGYETAVLFVALGLQQMETQMRWRILHFVTAALAIVAVLISGTRAAVLASVIGGLVLCAFRGARIISGRTLAALVLLSSAGFGLVLLSPRGKDIEERFRQWTEDPGGTRLPVWKDTLGLIGARPVTGSGPETFVVAFPRFQSPALSQRFPDFQHESPHNIFLDAAVSQGFVGVVALVFGIGLAGWCARRTPAASKPLAYTLLAGIAACVVFHQFFVFTLPNYCILLLLMCTLVSLAGSLQEPPVQAAPSRRIIVAASGAVFGVVLLASALQLSVTDYKFAQIDSLLMQGDLPAAVDAYHAARRSKLLGYAPDLWYSQQMVSAAQLLPPGNLRALAHSEALDASRIAAEHPGEDKLPAAYQRAVQCALAGQVSEAFQAARQMETAAPNWYQPHWVLSRLLFQQGEQEEARREAELALTLAGNTKPALHERLASYLRLLASHPKIGVPPAQQPPPRPGTIIYRAP